jgi:hypothetical protein
MTVVDPKITWAKLRAMADGARIASRELWKNATSRARAAKAPPRRIAKAAKSKTRARR